MSSDIADNSLLIHRNYQPAEWGAWVICPQCGTKGGWYLHIVEVVHPVSGDAYGRDEYLCDHCAHAWVCGFSEN